MELLSNARHALKTGKKPSFKVKSDFGAIVI